MVGRNFAARTAESSLSSMLGVWHHLILWHHTGPDRGSLALLRRCEVHPCQSPDTGPGHQSWQWLSSSLWSLTSWHLTWCPPSPPLCRPCWGRPAGHRWLLTTWSPALGQCRGLGEAPTWSHVTTYIMCIQWSLLTIRLLCQKLYLDWTLHTQSLSLPSDIFF